MRTDDVLAQIDTAVTDWTVSDDAMRSAPTPPPPDPKQAARETLTRRLIDHHSLSADEAADAIHEVERGLDGPHTHLVRAEARAAIHEATAPIVEGFKQMLDALRPAMEAHAAALRRIAESFQAARTARADDYALAPPPPSPRDRPAWQSPYGPAPRRRRP